MGIKRTHDTPAFGKKNKKNQKQAIKSETKSTDSKINAAVPVANSQKQDNANDDKPSASTKSNLFPRGRSKKSDADENLADSSVVNDSPQPAKKFRGVKNSKPGAQLLQKMKNDQEFHLSDGSDPADSRIDQFCYKDLKIDDLVLGSILYSKPHELDICLPYFMRGTCHIGDISQPYQNYLEKKFKSQNQDNKEEPVMSLDKLFQPGDYVLCKVKSYQAKGGDNNRTLINLSIDPMATQSHLTSQDLVPGMVVAAAVQSHEDHGILFSLGVSDFKGFLPKPSDVKQYPIGKVMLARVEKQAGRVATLSFDKRGSPLAQPTSQLESLTPGCLVPGKVTGHHANGIRVHLMGFFEAQIIDLHLPLGPRPKLGAKVNARILASSMSGLKKALHASLLPHLTKLSRSELTSYKEGYQIDKAEVVMSDVFNGLVMLPCLSDTNEQGGDDSTGLKSGKQSVGDKRIFPLLAIPSMISGPDEKGRIIPWVGLMKESKYAIGTHHKARVFSAWPMDGFLRVSLLALHNKPDYYTFHPLNFHQEVAGRIVKIDDSVGLTVWISDSLPTCLVPFDHTADTQLTTLRAKFQVGQTIQCRVLRKISRRVHLTCKPSLINSQHRFIWNTTVKPNQLSHGVITAVNHKAITVEFYNKIFGTIFQKELPESAEGNTGHYRVGQCVECRVISNFNQQLRLSLRLNDTSDIALKRQPMLDEKLPNLGEILSGEVISSDSTGLYIKLDGLERRCFLPKQHLSDQTNLAHLESLMEVAYPIGHQFNELKVISSTYSCILVTIKPLLLKSDAPYLVASINQLESDELVVGYVHQTTINSTKTNFLRLLGNVSLIIVGAHELDLVEGQTVVGVVQDLLKDDDQRPRARASLENFKIMKQLTPLHSLYHLMQPSQLLKDFLLELNVIQRTKHVDSSIKLESLISIQLQSNQSAKEDWIGKLADTNSAKNSFVSIPPMHYQGLDSLEPGHETQGRVIDIDYSTGQLVVSLLDRLLNNHTDSEAFSLDSHAHYEGIVELVQPRYVVVSLTLPNKQPYLFRLPMQSINQIPLTLVMDNKYKKSYPSVKLGERVLFRISDLALKLGTLLKTDEIITSTIKSRDLTEGMELKTRIERVPFEDSLHAICSLPNPAQIGKLHLNHVYPNYDAIPDPLRPWDKLDFLDVTVLNRVTITTKDKSKLLKEEFILSALPQAQHSTPSRGQFILCFVTKVSAAGIRVVLPNSRNFTIKPNFISNNKELRSNFQSYFRVGLPVECLVLAMPDKDCTRPDRMAIVRAPVNLPDGQNAYPKSKADNHSSREKREIEQSDDDIEEANSDIDAKEVKKQDLEFNKRKELERKMKKAKVEDKPISQTITKNTSEATKTNASKKMEKKPVPITSSTSTAKEKKETEKAIKLGNTEKPEKKHNLASLNSTSTDLGLVAPLEEEEAFDWDNDGQNLVDLEPESEPTTTEDISSKPAVPASKPYLLPEDKTAQIQCPQTVSDFEKALLASPNSSLVYIQYMAYYLKLANIVQAREIAQRALDRLPSAADLERYNIHVALLNLELEYGTPESVASQFEVSRVMVNKPKRLYLQLARLYSGRQSYDLAEQTYLTALKRFGSDSIKVWQQLATFYTKQLATPSLDRAKLLEKYRALLPRALRALIPSRHIKIITQFAKLEYTAQFPERGRTLFEGLIHKYPKRLDLWSVYIDLEIKSLPDTTSPDATSRIASVRRLFQRTIQLQLKPRKMKFLFKKFLEFETVYGQPCHIDEVRRLAVEYVADKMN